MKSSLGLEGEIVRMRATIKKISLIELKWPHSEGRKIHCMAL